MNSTKSSISESSFSERSESLLIRVRSVPSTGLITALYETSLALFSARIKSFVFTFFLVSMASVNPLNIWESITPEFPLAPMSSPSFRAFKISFVTVGSFTLSSHWHASSIAALMFEPVSPSGTGKTFNALISSLFFISTSVPFFMPIYISLPSR